MFYNKLNCQHTEKITSKIMLPKTENENRWCIVKVILSD